MDFLLVKGWGWGTHPGGMNRHFQKWPFQFVFSDICFDISNSIEGKFSCLLKVVWGYMWLRSVATNQGSHQPPVTDRPVGVFSCHLIDVLLLLFNIFQMDSFKAIHLKAYFKILTSVLLFWTLELNLFMRIIVFDLWKECGEKGC